MKLWNAIARRGEQTVIQPHFSRHESVSFFFLRKINADEVQKEEGAVWRMELLCKWCRKHIRKVSESKWEKVNWTAKAYLFRDTHYIIKTPHYVICVNSTHNNIFFQEDAIINQTLISPSLHSKWWWLSWHRFAQVGKNIDRVFSARQWFGILSKDFKTHASTVQ